MSALIVLFEFGVVVLAASGIYQLMGGDGRGR